MRRIVLIVAALAAAGSASVHARPGDRLRQWLANRAGAEAAAPLTGGETIAYGTDPLQQLTVWRASRTNGSAPLILFVHGGGWSKGSKDNATGRLKPPHYTGAGYAFASIDYRLVPDATVEQQAADVASALKALLDRAGQLGIDRSKVVIMGHSAGAHLVALVGTDERYLHAAGLSFADLDGVIPIDGAAFDVARQLEQAGPRMKQTYLAAFGSDPARQRALSPTLHAMAPNAARFYVPHVGRDDAVQQSAALAAALRRAGTPAETQQFEGRGLLGHLEINRRLGDPTYPATRAVDAWLKGVFGK